MVDYEYHRDGTVPEDESIFVFGSNLAGYHGAGAAAAAAKNFGAVRGCGTGLSGRSYAIPTKNSRLETLPIDVIQLEVQEFISYAKAHPQQRFFVTRVGCGYAGLADNVMAEMFIGAPRNCSFAESWKPFLQLFTPEENTP